MEGCSPEKYLILFLHRKSSAGVVVLKKVGWVGGAEAPCASNKFPSDDERHTHRREIIKMENFEARKCALGFLGCKEKIAVDNG
jgi:hypothetical protein